MAQTFFNPDQLKRFLHDNGYSQEDIGKNFDTYLEKYLSGLITFILNQFNEKERKEIVNGSDLNTNEGCLETIKRLNQKLSDPTFFRMNPTKQQVLSFIIGY